MDNLYQGLDATGAFTVLGVDGCSHLTRLELALAGHAELGIADEATFSVSPCVALEGLTENQTVNAAAGLVNITYSSPDHVVAAASPPAIGGNYVTHYLDGAYVGFSFLPGNAPFTGVTAGVHDFELRLAEGPVSLGQEQGGELVPRASTSITLDVQ